MEKDVDEASLNYILLHDMPRGKLELSEDLFRSEHSAVWKSHENMTWITMVNSIVDGIPQKYNRVRQL